MLNKTSRCMMFLVLILLCGGTVRAEQRLQVGWAAPGQVGVAWADARVIYQLKERVLITYDHKQGLLDGYLSENNQVIRGSWMQEDGHGRFELRYNQETGKGVGHWNSEGLEAKHHLELKPYPRVLLLNAQAQTRPLRRERVSIAEVIARDCQEGRVLRLDLPEVAIYDGVDAGVKGAAALENNQVLWFCPGEHKVTRSVAVEGLSIVRISGEAAKISARNDVAVMTITDCDTVVVRGLHLVHETGESCLSNCLDISDSKQVTVANCEFNGSGYQGITLYNSHGVVLENNRIHNCEHGFWAGESTGIVMRNNVFEHNRASDLWGIEPDDEMFSNPVAQDNQFRNNCAQAKNCAGCLARPRCNWTGGLCAPSCLMDTYCYGPGNPEARLCPP